MMKIRKTTLEDLDIVMEIYKAARLYMKEHGNPNQWKDTKPELEEVIKDINNGNHYIIYDDKAYGVFSFIIGVDSTYLRIDNGNWLNDLPYGTIHKIASLGEKKGILKTCLEYCSKLVDNIRIDTHEDNLTMQNALDKYGFTKCGIIYLENGDPRIAYQKIIR